MVTTVTVTNEHEFAVCWDTWHTKGVHQALWYLLKMVLFLQSRTLDIEKIHDFTEYEHKTCIASILFKWFHSSVQPCVEMEQSPDMFDVTQEQTTSVTSIQNPSARKHVSTHPVQVGGSLRAGHR